MTQKSTKLLPILSHRPRLLTKAGQFQALFQSVQRIIRKKKNPVIQWNSEMKRGKWPPEYFYVIAFNAKSFPRKLCLWWPSFKSPALLLKKWLETWKDVSTGLFWFWTCVKNVSNEPLICQVCLCHVSTSIPNKRLRKHIIKRWTAWKIS